MNIDLEIDKENLTNISIFNEVNIDNIEDKNCINHSNCVSILHFSRTHDLSQLSLDLFDPISCKNKPTFSIYKTDSLDKISVFIFQHKINLILVNYSDLQDDEFNSVVKIGTQSEIPILAIIAEEDEAIATTVLNLEVQDYITLEELEDSKIFRRVVSHTVAQYNSKKQHNILSNVIESKINDQNINSASIQSEESFHLLSERLPIGIFQLDSLGNSIYNNTYLENFYSSDTEIEHRKSWVEDLHPEDRAYLENIGAIDLRKNLSQCWMEYIHPDDQQTVLQSFEKFIQGINPFHCEFRLIQSQSDIRWVLGQGITLRETDGEMMGHIGTITDITDRKQAEENLKQLNSDLENRVFERTAALQQINLQLRIGNKIREFHEVERQRAEKKLSSTNDQLQAVLDAVPGCVAWVSADLTYLGVNRVMAQIFQLNISDFIGKKVGFIKSSTKEYVDFVEDFFNSSKDNLSKELLFEFNKEERFYLLIGQKYAQGQSAVFVAVEITERKRAEIETQNALEKVKELSELKSRFIFMVSHEFRTPLTSIFSASELLEHYGNKWSSDKKLQYLKQIQESVKRMNGLLEDVLIIGAGEVGKLKIQPTKLNIIDFCQHLIEEVQLSRKNNHIVNFTYDAQIQTVTIDAKLLNHILSNLLSNAVKYSPKKIPIDFNVWIDEKQMMFQVVDYGIGIPIEDQKHLFDIFHRASNVGTIGGTGIGLSIVKKSADALGGHISFQSDVNTGSKFTVLIPIQQLKEEYQW
jgi:signal transduction histidine kinase